MVIGENRGVPPDVSLYRLAPTVSARLVGAAVVLFAVVVLAVSLGMGLWGWPWRVLAWVLVVGGGLVGSFAWLLFRRLWVVRLRPGGYDVRLLGRVGASGAAWREVVELVATTHRGVECLVVRLGDGRSTTIPVAMVAGDREALARAARSRLHGAVPPRGDDSGLRP